MKISPPVWHPLTTLRVRLAVLLSVAVLPLGIAALVQTWSFVSEAQRLERTDITARTLRAANVERALLREAHGAAEALGAMTATLGSDRPECPRIMRSFSEANASILFAGFIDTDGIMRCSSTGERIDFGDFADWQSFRANPRPMVAYNETGAASGRPVLITTVPIYHLPSGALAGAASVSLPGGLMQMSRQPEFEHMKLALLDGAGNILAASREPERFTPFGIVPADLDIPETGLTRSVTNLDGQERLAVVVPLIEGRVYVLGVWDGLLQAKAPGLKGAAAPVFPILMWLIAIAASIYATDRLVLRHLTVLRQRMSALSFDAPGDSYAILKDAPPEIEAIAGTYNRMVDRLLADRTDLERAVEEKEVLLREVHHRVKNNLQLIASMINIQLRKVPGGPTRQILRRMQDRVMSLSSIHKLLYAGSTLTRVRADVLLREVVQSGLFIGLPSGAGVRTNIKLAEIDLDPDRAVPLTLLAGELATNAVKYVGRPKTGPASLSISLTLAGSDVVLCVENTTGTEIQPQEATEGTGLGSNLIEAFVSQLGAEMVLDDSEDGYRVTVTCPGLLADNAIQRAPADGQTA